ncbi:MULTISPECIES: phosphoenolpyruvate--protein phosphotransferase [Acinetobacter calcoaceticus/baumannii complex]|jgi:phosphoenolpyruvate-protein phosphotransferase|uniref:phosphoenolpyruvate--protein phosphotransferase n=1 Tax=Acinetobacter calcoaceticus/baumannii complex TaxID=909768 RepID=UPI00029EB781|nr:MULTISPECIES: phosphoenolpyruvate--protein phosphotransferase [Acinetobacter calcoaceticus/baumannii complex]AUT34114.1 phosphoenolpyruvate--protein phosphotransferase [Acinetobacter pittii]EKU66925.1 phosphoenolpyruvate-protein phosphotransferase [Acinetobacter pittii]EXG32601.1 phosphoenolpyruvate-protein phosphotransferase [Acinetobacter sp. 263903-2]KAI0678989.1 phosphoenolpyruvate--protein phosphotransferase [Acinetobacter pittii]KQF75766.1 PTS fructose transporter subunit IIA [Acineto
MLALEPRHIHMNQHAVDKKHALQCLVDILVKDGLVTPDYITGLINREQQSATYLGQGIAIPHGTPQSREFILETGIRLAHFPEGIIWDGENRIYLAVVIAAKSDEHLQVLQILTRALMHDVSEQVKNAKQPEQIIEILQAQPLSLTLHENLIQTEIESQDIEDLFWSASQILKKHNFVKCGFLSSLDPDQVIQLQDQIWSISSSKFVQQPAISIVKPRHALELGEKKLNTLVCIAANEQLDSQRFNRLIDILFNPEQVAQLDQTQAPNEIAKIIGADVIPDWPHRSVVLANAHGLHARPATHLVNLTKSFQGDIQVAVDEGNFVSAKSLTRLLALGCKRGQTLRFIAEPETDAVEALDKVILAVQQGLGEEVEPIKSSDIKVEQSSEIPSHSKPLSTNTGIAASSGLAFGPVHVIKPTVYQYERMGLSVKAEKEKLDIALHAVKNNIHQVIAKSEVAEIKQIFQAHLEMLDDPDLINGVYQKINLNLSAPAAWHEHIEAAAKEQAALPDRLLAERATDLRDIGDRVLAQLCGEVIIEEPKEPYILIMYDVGPSDVARLNKDRVAGILTAVGGASAHSAIVARALGIPAIVGAGDQVLDIEQKSSLLINGDTGAFILNPNAQQIEQAKQERDLQKKIREEAERHSQEPAITLDQHQIEIAANLGKVQATAHAVEYGAEAIGLLRTELVFMAHSSAPSEATQEADYRIVLDALAGRPLVVRTLDVGGDKPLPYLPIAEEENPFLGLRGIRLTLRQPELLRQQLIALLKAADDRPLRIMFPMIGLVEEWRAAKTILDEVKAVHPCTNLQVGIMIEVPSAALLAPILAKEVDFFSIGTNDLTQYTLAIDRGHPILSAEADGLHPSILQLIDQTVKAAHKYGKWVGICGELAADPKAVPILMGLGVDELSMSPNSIPLVKAQIRTLNYSQAQVLAKRALECDSATAVRQLSEQEM